VEWLADAELAGAVVGDASLYDPTSWFGEAGSLGPLVSFIQPAIKTSENTIPIPNPLNFLFMSIGRLNFLEGLTSPRIYFVL